ncbi:MAG TPA: YceI family protein [Solirubrobacteraceae bacterium]|jgi:polyisoprenoid-binding protein YceI|nr:YceI family protein [Solirubrobacteraceae bacterium]
MHSCRPRLRSAPFSLGGETAELARGQWELDPARSRVGFEVPHYWGFRTVTGRFTRYGGRLDLRATPAVELTVDAASIQTGNERRDHHLRSADFFAVDAHPCVRFVSTTARLEGDRLFVDGRLTAAGGHLDLELEALITPDDDAFELAAEVFVMHRGLGMTWNPGGFTRPYSKLIVAGRLVATTPEQARPESAPSDRPPIQARRGPCSKLAKGWTHR